MNVILLITIKRPGAMALAVFPSGDLNLPS